MSPKLEARTFSALLAREDIYKKPALHHRSPEHLLRTKGLVNCKFPRQVSWRGKLPQMPQLVWAARCAFCCQLDLEVLPLEPKRKRELELLLELGLGL